MAPEVVNRRGHSQSADWWSYGVLMVSTVIFKNFPNIKLILFKMLINFAICQERIEFL